MGGKGTARLLGLRRAARAFLCLFCRVLPLGYLTFTTISVPFFGCFLMPSAAFRASVVVHGLPRVPRKNLMPSFANLAASSDGVLQPVRSFSSS